MCIRDRYKVGFTYHQKDGTTYLFFETKNRPLVEKALKEMLAEDVYKRQPDGLMKITNDQVSKTYRLGDTSYITATDDERIDIIETNADIFNSLDIDNDMQLLILNRRVESNSLSSIRYDLVGDGYDDYRKEYNAMINDRFSQEQNTFKVEKYLTITTQTDQDHQARRILDDTASVIESQYSGLGISFKELELSLIHI